ncbi:MAG: hypothetical protein ACYST5_00685 [Planctomycetota bacterium]|jgi:hypothetical protein
MTKDKIENLLQKADQMAGDPTPVSANLSAVVRRRAHRRRIATFAAPLAAAAVVLIALGIWGLIINFSEKTDEQRRVAQIKQSQARSDASLKLPQEVVENGRRQQRLDELEAQLASIPDPIEEIQKQVDKTAFILVYQADRMYRELDLKASAIQTYKRVIKLFGQTKWAEVARNRLAEIKNNQNKKDSKGDLLWKPQNALSSC